MKGNVIILLIAVVLVFLVQPAACSWQLQTVGLGNVGGITSLVVGTDGVLHTTMADSTSNTGSAETSASRWDPSDQSTVWDIEPSGPMDLKLTVSTIPLVNEETTLSCEVSSVVDIPGTKVKINLPPGVVVIRGNIEGDYDLQKNKPVNLIAVVKFTKPGDYRIEAQAQSQPGVDHMWGALDALYLTIGTEQSGYTLPPSYVEMAKSMDGRFGPAPTISIATLNSDVENVKPLTLNEKGSPYDEALVSAGAGSTLKVQGRVVYNTTVTDGIIQDYRPNELTAVPLISALVLVKDYDTGQVLAQGYTNRSGHFAITIQNPSPPAIQVFVYAYLKTSDINELRVVSAGDSLSGLTNVWAMATGAVATPSGPATLDIGTFAPYPGSDTLHAFWLFQDIVRARAFLSEKTIGHMDQEVYASTILWYPTFQAPEGAHYHFWGQIHMPGTKFRSADTTTHEYGHNYMTNNVGSWNNDCPSPHFIDVAHTGMCGYTEGWADFMALAVNNNSDYQWSSGSWINLEVPNRTQGIGGNFPADTGPLVEGRVAGALWDILDTEDDGFDTYSAPFLVIDYAMDKNYGGWDFGTYWNTLVSNGPINKDGAGACLYQNTIDYYPPYSSVPTITYITPDSVTAGDKKVTIRVHGSGFVPWSTVRTDEYTNLKTNFISETILDADLVLRNATTGAYTSLGAHQITVFNRAPGGGTSNNAALTVTSQLPTIISISPASAKSGSPPFTLIVNGTGFYGGSGIRWDDVDTGTTYISPTQLSTKIYPYDIDGGSYTITVFNEPPGGGTSNNFRFTVLNPTPLLTSIEPSVVTVGGSEFWLTVTGAGFSRNSTVLWNNIPLSTTFISVSKLEATVPASLITSSGTMYVKVTNPSPGGGTSTSLPLTLVNPSNILLSHISPSTVTKGGPGFTLTVVSLGPSWNSQFVRGTQIQWNGVNQTTTYIDSTHLSANIPASYISDTGHAMVRVWTPPPGGGISSSMVCWISNPVPSLTAFSPQNVTAGGPSFILTISGRGFINNTELGIIDRRNPPLLSWGWQPTKYLSSTQRTVTIPAAQIATAGNLTFVGHNDGPGGGSITAFNITVNNPVPIINGISPSSVSSAGPEFNLNVSGTGFTPNSTVRISGGVGRMLTRTTTYVSPTKLVAKITAADILDASIRRVDVYNPKPGGGVSNVVNLSVKTPYPSITSLSPDTVKAGGSGFNLDVTGTGFVPTSSVILNSGVIPTTFLSPTHLMGWIQASDIKQIGVFPIRVVNPSILVPEKYDYSNSLLLKVINPNPPAPKFNATPKSGNTPLLVQFTDMSDGSPTSWNWSFGDGNYSSLQNPAHSYEFTGQFTVTLNASNSNGNRILSQNNYITVTNGATTPHLMVTSPDGGETWQRGTSQMVTWNYSGTPGSFVRIELLKGGAFYQLVKSNTSIGSAGSGSYLWTISANTKPGTDYRIRINSTGNSALSDTSNANFAIGGSSNPVVKFSTNVTSGNVPLSVKFTDLSTGTSMNKWNWSFGDGIWFNTTTASLRNATHTYSAAGTYMAKLTVCNASGCNTTVPGTTITVNSPGKPVVKFSTNVTSGNVPLSVKFTDMSTGTSLNKWNWSFGDGMWFNTTTASLRNTTHAYSAAGTYTAKLTVCNASGCNTTVPGTTITVGTATTSIAVTSPNGGEAWKQNSSHAITWSYTGNPGSFVKIELLKNGMFYQLVKSNTSIGSAGSGSYPWTISANTRLGTDYKIRINSTSNSAYTDMSNGNFTIN